jgi:hypothetical protein
MRPTSLPHGLLLATVVTALAACPSTDAPAPTGDDAGPGPLLRFSVLPSSITCADDADPEAPGEQVRVTVVLENADGASSTVTLENGDEELTATFDEKNRASFLATLEGSGEGTENTLVASARVSIDGANVALETDEVVVVDTCVPPPSSPVTCAFERPVPGAFSTFVVPVRVAIAGGDLADAAQQAALRNADVRVDVTPGDRSQALSAETFVANGSVDVGGAGVFTLTATIPGEDGAPLATCSVEGIEVTATTSIASPANGATFDAADDLDEDIRNGVSVALTGTTTLDVDQGSWEARCTGQPTLRNDFPVARGAGLRSFDATVERLAGESCILDVTLGDTTITRAFHVDATGAALLDLDVEPDADNDGVYELADDTDGSTSDIIDVPFTVRPTLPPGTWTATVTILDEAGLPVGSPVDLGTLVDGADATGHLALPAAPNRAFDVLVTAQDGAAFAAAPFGRTLDVDAVAP